MTIFVWKEVYVVGQVDADSSGESDDSESDNVKRRDRRGYIDTISNPAYFFANHESEFVLKMKWVIIPVSAPIPDRDSIFTDEHRALK